MGYALMVVTVLLGLFGLLKEYFPRRSRPWLIRVTLTGLLLSGVIQGYVKHEEAQKTWQTKWSGRLRSPSKSSAKLPAIVLGQTKVIYQGDPTKPAFVLADEPLFVRVQDGEAQLSVVIRDKDGIVLAAIRDNDWFVAPSRALDRNFNQNSLEVINSKGDVVFQVRVQGEEVHIAGSFYPKEGGPAPAYIGPWLHQLEGKGGSLFKYPSGEHAGELNQ
jgi:hypothetical protein